MCAISDRHTDASSSHVCLCVLQSEEVSFSLLKDKGAGNSHALNLNAFSVQLLWVPNPILLPLGLSSAQGCSGQDGDTQPCSQKLVLQLEDPTRQPSRVRQTWHKGREGRGGRQGWKPGHGELGDWRLSGQG